MRLRLTLWNVAGLALLLLALGATLRYTLQANLSNSIDGHMAQDARRMQDDFARFPPSALEGGGGHRPPFGRRESASGQDGPLPPRLLGLNGRGLPPFPAGGAWDPDLVSLSAQGRTVYSTIQMADGPARVLSVPLWQAGRVIGVLQIGFHLAAAEQEMSHLTHVLLTLIPLALLVAGVGGALLTGRTLQPVRRITQAAGRIGAEDLSGRLSVTGDDEFGQLAATFNGMLGRLEEAFTRLSQANRELTQAYEQQRRFTADASHELRTPLTIIKANTSLALMEARTEPEYRQALEAVDRAADRTSRLVQDLLLLARADAGHLRLKRVPLAVQDVLDQTLEAAGGREDPRVRLDVSALPECVLGDADSLERLFSNLLSNARRHTPADGLIVVSARPCRDGVVVQVHDTGSGIAPEHLPHLFERFYRADEARSGADGGTGLGLAICRSIAEAHEGTIEIESVVGGGTTVRVLLPGPERAANGGVAEISTHEKLSSSEAHAPERSRGGPGVVASRPAGRGPEAVPVPHGTDRRRSICP